MTLGHFLPRIKVDKSNPHEIIAILFYFKKGYRKNIMFILGLEHKKYELL